MRNYPNMNDEYDIEEVKLLNNEQWQLECLKMNPSYTGWGIHEDYMCKKDGWDGALEFESIDEGLFNLDEYNELVNFYFEIYRNSKPCEHCGQSGYNPETKKLSDSWYGKPYYNGGWSKNITQDEVDALWEHNRLHVDFKTKPTAEQVNEWAKKSFGHDSINQWICVETRAKRLDVYGKCEHCKGNGNIYTSPSANLGLQLWYIHPRKGCSRGVYIKNINKEDLPKVVEFLKEAKKRNAKRFSKLI